MFDAKTLDAWLMHIEVLHSKPIDLGLDRMKTMVERMGLDFSSRTVITVGGTNGKGSTCAMLESIYRAAGYTTGMHTSPHLIRLNERCVVNGREVDDERLMDAFRAVEKARGDMTLSYFEYTALAILRIFREDELDVVILEIGLGGRLDAINTIDSNAAVISTIGIDHVAFLGNTREAIGLEKAHIYRPGCPAVCADADVPATVRNHVEQIGAKRLFAGEDWTVTVKENGTFTFAQGATLFEDLPEPALAGVNQYRNAGGVLSVIASLMDRVPVTLDDIRTGLRQVRLTARFELITTDPVPTVIDVGHNPQAAEVLLTNVVRSRRPGEHTIAVCGMLADKDMAGVTHILADAFDEWHVASLTGPRAATAAQLHEAMLTAGVEPGRIHEHADVAQALAAARESAVKIAGGAESGAEQAVRIVVFGSFVTVTAAPAGDEEPTGKKRLRMPAFGFMKRKAAPLSDEVEDDVPDEEILVQRQRTRYRLVGAAALMLGVIVVSPLLLDREQDVKPPVSTEIPAVPETARTTLNALPGSSGDVDVTANGAAAEQSTSRANLANEARQPVKTEPAPKAEAAKPAPAPAARPEPKKAEEKPAKKSSATDGKGFYVQVLATSSERNAEKLVRELSAKGYPAYKVSVSQKAGTLWRVRVGNYATRDEARGVQGTLVLDGHTGQLIVGNNP